MNPSSFKVLFCCLSIAGTVIACAPASRPFVPADAGADSSTATCARAADCDDNIACTRDTCIVGGICEHAVDNSMCPMGQSCVVGMGCRAMGARTCMRVEDCNDNIACTRDTCLVEGICQNQAQSNMCPMGQTCDTTLGCTMNPSRCMGPADCNDNIDCTEDTCNVMGTCEHVPQNGRCMAPLTCNAGMGCIRAANCRDNSECDDHVYCNGAETCSPELACRAGTAINCADMDPCTIDACNEGMRMCTHTMDPMCMGGNVMSGIYDLDMSVMYSCQDLIGQPALTFTFRAFQITVGARTVVTGAPASMMGDPPRMNSFSVTGTARGSCDETYSLVGRFSDPTHFSGTFTWSFAGAACGLTNCMAGMRMVTGTYRP